MTDNQDKQKRWPLDLEVRVPPYPAGCIEFGKGARVFIFGVEVYGVMSIRYETVREADQPTTTKITIEVAGDPIRVTHDPEDNAKPAGE